MEKQSLKIVIVGYGELLASLISGVLASKNEIVGVMRDDRVKYDPITLFLKDILCPSRDYSFLKSYNFHEIKAKSVNSVKFREEIKKLQADLILVGSWSEKFSLATILTPQMGCINCHPSLLPRHRGANPYFRVLYCGDKKTGVTFHLMDENFDRGDILFQCATTVEKSLDAYTLKLKCCKIAEIMIRDLLFDLKKGRVVPVKQEEKDATYECQISENDCILDLRRSLEDLKNHIRALMPYFYPHFRANKSLFEAKNWTFIEENDFLKNFESGDVVSKSRNIITMKCLDGAIEFEI